MSEPEFKQVEELFLRVADLPPGDRAAYLDRACGGDDALRRAVLDLLRHDAEIAETGDFLVSPVTRAAERLRPSAAREEPVDMPKIAGFELLDAIGRGGMGIVYRARQIGLGRIVAIKTLTPDAFESADQRERFRAEAELLARIQQPNIVPIFDVGEVGGRPFFVMEYVPGGNLGQRLMGRPQDPTVSARLIATLARAMQEVHAAGIVHRDLKPANILLRGLPRAVDEGGLAALIPKITDFGVAKDRVGDRRLTRTGTAIGTPSYMAPEQAGPKGNDVGPAADVYSLGAILYEMLTGRPPFDAVSPAETLAQVLRDDPLPPHRLRGGIPRDLSAVCLKCLEKSPRQRYATAADLADDLERFLAGEPTRARPRGLFGRALRWGRRHPLAAGLAGLSVVLAVALAVTATSFTLRLRSARDELQAQAEQQKGQIVRLHVIMGEADAASGDVCAAMLRFAEALRLDKSAENRERVARLFPEFPRLVEEFLPAGVIRAARFDGRRAFLAVESSDGVIQIHDSESGEVSGPIRFPGGKPRLLAPSGDGRTLVAVSAAGELCVARLSDGVIVVHDAPRSVRIESVAIDRTGASVCTRHVDATCRYWKVANDRIEPTTPSRDEAAEWSGSARWSTQPHEDGRLRIIDSLNGEVLRAIAPPPGFARFAVSPAADRVVAFDGDGRLQFWDGQAPQADARLARGFGSVTDVRFDVTGRHPVISGDRGRLQVFDPLSGASVTPVISHGGPLVAVRYDAASRELIAVGASNGVRIWGLSGQPIRRTRFTPIDPAACEADELVAWLQFASGVRLSESGHLVELHAAEMTPLRNRFGPAGAGRSTPGRGE